MHHATQYIYPHNAATAASAPMSATQCDAFQYAQPAAHAPYQQPNAADLGDIPIMEATPAEGFLISFQDSLNIMEPHRQSMPMTNRQVPPNDVSRPVDYHILPMDQGNNNNKGYKKNNNSPRKNYATATSGRLQHRQKFVPKHVNGIHILAYNQNDRSDDMHTADVSIQSVGGPITPPSTPMTPSSLNQDVASPIIESTRKLQALSL